MATNGVVSTETEHALVVWVLSLTWCRALRRAKAYEISLQINSFSLEGEVESLGQLNDGQVFWQMLRGFCLDCPSYRDMNQSDTSLVGDIDSDAFPESLPNNKQSDYARRKNCEHDFRGLTIGYPLNKI